MNFHSLRNEETRLRTLLDTGGYIFDKPPRKYESVVDVCGTPAMMDEDDRDVPPEFVHLLKCRRTPCHAVTCRVTHLNHHIL
jgi:hypothetical protein